jgi:Beta/Gamma crystallin
MGRISMFSPQEPNLAAGDDSFFNDRVSSIVVVEGHWHFFRHVNFVDLIGILNPGVYPWVQDVGFPNDQMSSLLLVTH